MGNHQKTEGSETVSSLQNLVSCALTRNWQKASPRKWEGINPNSTFCFPFILTFFKDLNWLQFKDMLKNI